MHITVFETNKRLYYSPEYIASTLSVMKVVLGGPCLDTYDDPSTKAVRTKLSYQFVVKFLITFTAMRVCV